MDTPTGIVSCQVQIWTDIGRYVNAARRSRSDDARAKAALRVHVAECHCATDFFGIPPDRVIELGGRIEF